MDLTRSLVETTADEYAEEGPLYPVERDQIESLGDAYASGGYGWRDVEWVVRWYYRRHLGAVSDAERRAVERRFDENDFETVRAVIGAVVAAEDLAARVDRLTDLDGVDVPIASAYLFYLDPDRYVVVGEREWAALSAADELDGPYPDPPTVEEYERYLEVCRSLCSGFECDMWTLYRALWRLGGESAGE